MFLEIDDDFFQMTFDWGHANTYTIPFAKKTSKKNFREYCENYGYVHEVIDELKDKIVYAHLHYNDANKYSGFVKKRIDAHRPFTDIPFREMEKIRKTYLRLFNETKIEDFKLVNLELPPKKVFFITIYPEAVSDNVQYLENLEFFKKIVQNEE
ncbi:MAG: hypothetical protein ACD_63C00257G0006 [uncultured bacterium]|nr:MAG: hypothetical protein ACD_63C00257G0006 [uncultured bacterium]